MFKDVKVKYQHSLIERDQSIRKASKIPQLCRIIAGYYNPFVMIENAKTMSRPGFRSILIAINLRSAKPASRSARSQTRYAIQSNAIPLQTLQLSHVSLIRSRPRYPISSFRRSCINYFDWFIQDIIYGWDIGRCSGSYIAFPISFTYDCLSFNIYPFVCESIIISWEERESVYTDIACCVRWSYP